MGLWATCRVTSEENVCECLLHLCLCATCVLSACEAQKRTLDPLELDAVNHHVDAGN